MHDCGIKLFRDSSKELFSDQLYYAEQIGKGIDPDVREYTFEIKPEVIPWRMQGKLKTTHFVREKEIDYKFYIIRLYFAWGECGNTFLRI